MKNVLHWCIRDPSIEIKQSMIEQSKNFSGRTYTNSTVNAWNSLPAEVVSAETVNIFLKAAVHSLENPPPEVLSMPQQPPLQSKYIRPSILCSRQTMHALQYY